MKIVGNKLRQSMVVVGVFFVLISLYITGCEVDSADEIIRQVAIRVAGFYYNGNGQPLVLENTGNAIITMNLMQSGDQLEGVDNNGLIFRGSISQADSQRAVFMIEGQTTTGAKGIIHGTILVTTGTADAEMRGTWTEDALSSAVYGTAQVPQHVTPTNAPTTNVVINT